LLVDLKTTEKISNNDKRKAEGLIASLFNLKLDLKPFYKKAKDDKILFNLTQKLRGLKSPTTPTVFESLISSIIEQQISLNVAHTLETRIVRTFGDALRVDMEAYFAFPTPQELASTNIKKLRECGLNLRKAEYILNVSRLIAHRKLNLDDFQSYENADAIIRELDQIRGIGVWTAELTMIRGMHKFDVIPADDLGLRRCISHYYCNDQKIDSIEARKIAEKWGKWKGLASFYLIMAEQLEIIA
jgi:DNA-3-methyladenine glycosylase II